MFQLRTLLLCVPFLSMTATAELLPTVASLLPELQGSLPVATSNLTLKEVLSREEVKEYLNGSSKLFGGEMYVNDVLATDRGVLTFPLTLPDDASSFGSLAGDSVTITGMVFYPTNDDNSRADYVVPARVFEDREVVLQHMQVNHDVQRSEHRYPLVLFSHGFAAHPLYDFDFLQKLASHGMVVVALLHGDRRFDDFKEMQSLRAYGLIEAVRRLRLSPWRQLPDYSHTGVIGVSFGGSVALALAGAQLNDYEGLALPEELASLRAVIGMVPATTYRGDAKWSFDKLQLDPLLIMAEKDESVAVAPELELIDANENFTPDVAVLKGEGHFVSASKWRIARQLVLLKLR